MIAELATDHAAMCLASLMCFLVCAVGLVLEWWE